VGGAVSEERLELVTRFEELRVGMLVVVKPCGLCRLAHRGILTRFVDADPLEGAWKRPDGRLVPPGQSMAFLPLACEERTSYVTEYGVREHRIYRVVIPPADASHETKRTRTREHVK
jgi:hypothetical protein